MYLCPLAGDSVSACAVEEVLCGLDYTCADPTDNVLVGAVCASPCSDDSCGAVTCTDEDCCEPAEPGEQGVGCVWDPKISPCLFWVFGRPVSVGACYGWLGVDLIPAPANRGSYPPFLISVTCGADHACASSTDTVLEDALCSSGTCTDEECCEPTQRGERGAWCVCQS